MENYEDSCMRTLVAKYFREFGNYGTQTKDKLLKSLGKGFEKLLKCMCA